MLSMGVRRLLKSSSSPERRQLGEIFEGGLPFRILVIKWMMTRESPSRIILRCPLCMVACNPLKRPVNSATLLVVSPRKPARSPRICPFWISDYCAPSCCSRVAFGCSIKVDFEVGGLRGGPSDGAGLGGLLICRAE
jgi:hypothetical protein